MLSSAYQISWSYVFPWQEIEERQGSQHYVTYHITVRIGTVRMYPTSDVHRSSTPLKNVNGCSWTKGLSLLFLVRTHAHTRAHTLNEPRSNWPVAFTQSLWIGMGWDDQQIWHSLPVTRVNKRWRVHQQVTFDATTPKTLIFRLHTKTVAQRQPWMPVIRFFLFWFSPVLPIPRRSMEVEGMNQSGSRTGTRTIFLWVSDS